MQESFYACRFADFLHWRALTSKQINPHLIIYIRVNLHRNNEQGIQRRLHLQQTLILLLFSSDQITNSHYDLPAFLS